MQDKVTYEYAVIRFVPRVEREEFVNIGVILFSKRRNYLNMKTQISTTKISAVYPETNFEQLMLYLQAWEWVCKGSPKGGKIGELDLPSRFRWLTSKRSTIIQTSPTHPGLSANLDETLEKLFKTYVL